MEPSETPMQFQSGVEIRTTALKYIENKTQIAACVERKTELTKAIKEDEPKLMQYMKEVGSEYISIGDDKLILLHHSTKKPAASKMMFIAAMKEVLTPEQIAVIERRVNQMCQEKEDEEYKLEVQIKGFKKV